MRKPLTAAPPRLQRMLLCLQPYDVTVVYWPGKEVLLADGLSRLTSHDTGVEKPIDLDIQINHVMFSSHKVSELQMETEKDRILSELKTVIVSGWPDKMKDLPKPLQSY